MSVHHCVFEAARQDTAKGPRIGLCNEGAVNTTTLYNHGDLLFDAAIDDVFQLAEGCAPRVLLLTTTLTAATSSTRKVLRDRNQRSNLWRHLGRCKVLLPPGTSSTTAVYTIGGGFNADQGRYYAPLTGYYFCSNLLRLDGASSSSYFRINMVLNRGADLNNGFHGIRGNKGSTH